MRLFYAFKLTALLAVFVSCTPAKKSNDIGSEESRTFSNPLPVKFGDPYILDDGNDHYFMYGTGQVKNGFGAYSSTDLIHWKFEGPVYKGNTAASWCTGAFWAPEVYKKDGKYYMFFSAQWRENPEEELENFRIGVAVSDHPTGPFNDVRNAPLFDPGYPVIDANVLMDEEGKHYLYYSRVCYKHPVESEVADWAKEQGLYEEIEESWIYGVELKPDFSGVIGDPVLLLRPPLTMDDAQAEWESRSVTSGEINRRWTEGSFIFRYDEKYYMMYSANHFADENYAVGYATSQHPLGPFTKAANNPVLQKNTANGGDVTGTGHNSVLFLNDVMYCVYHGRTTKTGKERVVFIDRMAIEENRNLVVYGPSTERQPAPVH